MLKIKQMQIKADLDAQLCSLLVDDLQGSYNFLIYGIKRDYLNKLKLSLRDEYSYIKETLFPMSKDVVCGDLVFLEPDSIMYYKVKEARDSVEIGIIGDTGRREIRAFAEHVKASLDAVLDDSTGDWRPVKRIDPSISVLLEHAVSFTPSEAEIAAAQELADPRILQLMKLINQQDSVFQDTLVEKMKADSVDEEVRTFEHLGMVTTDFSLLCSKTGQQILRVPDRSALEDISKKGFRCFLCGSSIADEKLVRAITISDFGKKILENDRWFLILTPHALNDLGIPYDEMHVIMDESPDTKIFLNVNDESMVIQLVNRKLTLDDAYLMNANIAAYQLNFLTVISTGVLSRLMKSHLRETNANTEVDFIEGIDSLKDNLSAILMEKEKNRIVNILKEMSTLTPVPVEDLILKKVIPEGKLQPYTGLENILAQEEAVATEAPEEQVEITYEDATEPDEELIYEEATDTADEEEYYTSGDLVEDIDVEDEIISGVDEDPLIDLKEV